MYFSDAPADTLIDIFSFISLHDVLSLGMCSSTIYHHIGYTLLSSNVHSSGTAPNWEKILEKEPPCLRQVLFRILGYSFMNLYDTGILPLKNDVSRNLNHFLQLSAEYGMLDLVDFIIQRAGVSPSTRDNVAVYLASKNGHDHVVELLLSFRCVDPSSRNHYAFRLACKNGHLNIVKLLLQDTRVDPSADNNYAIRWACANGHLEIAKLLLISGRVDPTAYGSSAYSLAFKNGHADVVKLLNDFNLGTFKILKNPKIKQKK